MTLVECDMFPVWFTTQPSTSIVDNALVDRLLLNFDKYI